MTFPRTLTRTLTLYAALCVFPAHADAYDDARVCFQNARFNAEAGLVFNCTMAIESLLSARSRGEEINTRLLAASYSNRGIMLANSGDGEAALADHAEAIHLQPNVGELFVNRGNSYLRLKQYRSAYSDYSQAIEMLRGVSKPIDQVIFNQALAYKALGYTTTAMNTFELAIQSVLEGTEDPVTRESRVRKYQRALADTVEPPELEELFPEEFASEEMGPEAQSPQRQSVENPGEYADPSAP